MITSATYNASTNALIVTGINMQATAGAANDIDVSKLTLTGQGGATYTLTSSNVELDSATQFTVTLNAVDQINIEGLLNNNGTSSVDGVIYNIAAAAGWNPAVSSDTDLTGNGVTVSNVQVPTITSATYDISTGIFIVTGADLVKASGATNDIDASMLILTGEGGSTYTLTDTSDVEITSGTLFVLTLSNTDKTAVNQIFNKNGTSSTDGTVYKMSATDDWNTTIDNSNIADVIGNAITVSNVPIPAISSATYEVGTGALTVTGSGFLKLNGFSDDIVASKFTFTGDGGDTYTLTDSANVEITSSTAFTITLSPIDKTAINRIVNKNGTSSTGGTTYNLAAAEDWAAGADAAIVVADATNGITVSNVAVPTITSATYNATSGVLEVTGSDFSRLSGAANDIVTSKFTFTGEGGDTYRFTDSVNVEVTSPTTFTITLNATDKAALNQIINKNGTSSIGGITYNLAAAEDWAAGADTAIAVADLTGNGVTVSYIQLPTITSAIYYSSTGTLIVTGTNLVKASGAANDIDASMLAFTGEGGSAYTLTDTSDVEITSGTSFTLTLSNTDKNVVNLILNKDGTSSIDGTAYNLTAQDDWNTTIDNTNIADTTGAITVSSALMPAIASATYNASTNALIVTGINMQATAGIANDIDVSKLTLTGQGGATYTLTSSNVELDSATRFTVTLNADDQINVEGLLNKSGTSSVDGITYNIAAAAGWNPAVSGDADLAGNGITVTLSSSSSGGGDGSGSSTRSIIIDGAAATMTTQPDGTVVIAVSTIQSSRQDDPNSLFRDYADIPVAKDAKGNSLLTVSLPTGTGLTVTEQPQVTSPAQAETSIMVALTQINDSDAVNNLTAQVKAFFAQLSNSNPVNIQIATPNVFGDKPPALPIIISSPATAGTTGNMLVIDARQLPTGTDIQLDNVALALIVGATRIVGGNGQNFVTGDDQDQLVVLGPGDDILFGGGGDDTVGSFGGNDQISGDAGNDIVYGGAGNDVLNGGSGNDQINGGFGFDSAIQAGQLSDYRVDVHGNTVTLTQANGETDTLTDVELVRFASGPSLAIAYSEAEAVAHHLVRTWLERDLTAAEGNAVQNLADTTAEDVLVLFRSLPETIKLGLQDKTSSELLSGWDTDPTIIRIDATRDVTGGAGNDQDYLPLGLAMNVDGGAGYDVLRMPGGRNDVHLEFSGNRLELTQLSDGAMLSLKNAEMIAFDSNETVVFAHNPVEGILARLAHSFFDRDATVAEWQLGFETLHQPYDANAILNWFQQHADLQTLSDNDYIQAIYNHTLGRSATSDELNQQLVRLGSHAVDRNWLTVDIAQSDEAAAHLIGSVILQEGWI